MIKIYLISQREGWELFLQSVSIHQNREIHLPKF